MKSNKKIYVEGEQFDPTGMEVIAFYNDGTSHIVTDYEIEYENGTDRLEEGQTLVKILYKEDIAEQEIIVNGKEIIGIEIKTNPTKMNYTEGENFDPTGMEVNVIYEDNSKKLVTDYDILNGENLEVGNVEITIQYFGKQTKLTVSVTSNNGLDFIYISVPPQKTQYIEGENFDSSQMIVNAVHINERRLLNEC